jgi:hypothetical protein
MKAARKDFGAANNTPWLTEITVYLADGTLADLSLYTSFAMHVKTDAFDPEEQLAPTVTSPSAGVLRIAHDLDDDLAALWGLYVYDVIGLDGSGDPVDTIMIGTINVNQGVTVI